MDFAKPAIDLGLYTNQREPMLAFWQQRAGVAFDELLPAGRGIHQLRHTIGTSILKINHSRDPLEHLASAGFTKLWIVRPDITQVTELHDPDGNAVTLAPAGHQGIDSMQIDLHTPDIDAAADFYGKVLGLTDVGGHRFQLGETLLQLIQNPTQPREPVMRAVGYRYITVQVFDVLGTHQHILKQGGREGSAPRKLGDVAHISFVRDPDGNWIEISQRKSITGSLD
jgi:catechol 2,3-dioxygenase-like lactoylglutathione lyase family enzyme